ncbi:hypothetical protein QVD17_14611 [Tagetes erecta]|uniref:Uncharacterized protein n=1 Tax=Tagetes erecta TaxID=13708 RepID=A0AAD8NYV1_TARER|nr:hypothetical protein QVD17_14611 [Tagetes erecta]
MNMNGNKQHSKQEYREKVSTASGKETMELKNRFASLNHGTDGNIFEHSDPESSLKDGSFASTSACKPPLNHVSPPPPDDVPLKPPPKIHHHKSSFPKPHPQPKPSRSTHFKHTQPSPTHFSKLPNLSKPSTPIPKTPKPGSECSPHKPAHFSINNAQIPDNKPIPVSASDSASPPSEFRRISNVLFNKANNLSDEQENEIYILVDKRYVPKMEEFAQWSQSQRNFYDHLCSLTHFVEGCKAVGEYESVNDIVEVESDLDEDAQDMKIDCDKQKADFDLQSTQVLGTTASSFSTFYPTSHPPPILIFFDQTLADASPSSSSDLTTAHNRRLQRATVTTPSHCEPSSM